MSRPGPLRQGKLGYTPTALAGASRADSPSRAWAVAAWVLATAGLALALALAMARPPRGLWGDEGTYLAMTASLARDGDLEFSVADREWALKRPQGPPATVILQRVGDRITYSKPVLYPLLALPFYALLGASGLIALNLALALGGLWLAWLFLRRMGPPPQAALTLVTFAACSVLPFYLGWRMSDVAQVALALAGLVLAAGALRAPAGRRPLWLAAAGGLLLGLVASMRFPGAALAAAPVAGGLWAWRPRRALAIGLAALLGFAAAVGAGALLAGTANPYKALRSSYSGATGYPVAGDSEAAARFETHPATQSAGWLPRPAWTRSAYAAIYYLVGRHTGLLLYFPAALFLLVTCLRRPDRVGLALLAGPAAMVLFYLLWMPENYFGGSTFIGNRYFLVAYPALLVALPRLPTARWLAAAWLVGAVAGGSALASVRATRDIDPGSQNHAAAGIFRLLPNESTAQKVDGFRARYWARDFVRFTDRFADVGDDGFRLRAGAPPAELELAFRIPRDRLLLAVTSGLPGGELIWRDWSGGGALPVAAGGQMVELVLSPAWRWHTYWWRAPDVYQVRTLRLWVEHPTGADGEVELRNLGGPWRPRRAAG